MPLTPSRVWETMQGRHRPADVSHESARHANDSPRERLSSPRSGAVRARHGGAGAVPHVGPSWRRRDRAADGSIEGFVGGQCAEESVRVGRARRPRSTVSRCCCASCPDGSETFPDTPGAADVVNPCLSGGAIEIFLEPRLPAARVTVVGDTPIADAVASSSPTASGSPSAGSLPSRPAEGTIAVDRRQPRPTTSRSIRAALDAGVGVHRARGEPHPREPVLEALDLTADERDRVHTPVGLDIGARTAEEIALSIMAEVVRAMRVDGLQAPTGRRRTARDRRRPGVRHDGHRAGPTLRTCGPTAPILVLQPRLPRPVRRASRLG